MNKKLHRTLTRQLHKLGLDSQRSPDALSWSNFLNLVEKTYHDADAERIVLDRSLEISSEEMQTVYLREKSIHEARLRAVFNSTQDLIWLKDPEGIYLACNPTFERLFGASAAEIVGKSDYDFVDRALADSFLSHDRAVIEKQEPCSNEEWLTFAENQYYGLFETVKTPIYDDAGQLMGVMGVARDITERKRIAESIKSHEQQLSYVLDATGEGIWDWDIKAGAISHNSEWCKIAGLDDRYLSHSLNVFAGVLHEADSELVFEKINNCLTGEGVYHSEHRFRRANNEIVWILDRGKVVERDELGVAIRMVGSVVDITQRKQEEGALKIAALVYQFSSEAMLVTDFDNNIIDVNPAFTRITGYAYDEVIGENPRIFQSGMHDDAFYRAMWADLLARDYWQGEIWDKRKGGEVYPKLLTINTIRDDSGKVVRHVALFSDISEKKKSEEMIWRQANYDVLTGLPNRRLLMDRLASALSLSVRNSSYGALLFIDMDKFKMLNDTLGHDYGDLLLVEVAARARSCVREIDTVARFGGDEFVILIEEVDIDEGVASHKASQIAEKIRQALAQPYCLKSIEYSSSPSIGVSLYRGDEHTVDEVMKHSDLAMYQAKDSGRNTVRFFDPEIQRSVENRLIIEADLLRAVAEQQLHLYYQIQVDNHHRPLGAEALVRWMHPVRGMVSPAQFIPVAEESSLIIEIGHWVLLTACKQLGLWAQDEITMDLTLAVNVSTKQFRQHDFVTQVGNALRDYRVMPSRLKLELTESVVLNDVTDVVTKMYALKALGVRLSLDDFGTGYSSLAYLKNLPLDQIKIDQSFVRGVATDQNDAVMVKTIIDLAHNFGLNVIAEGVETQSQLDFLKQNNCMAYQGYLFSKPVPVAQFDALLRQGDALDIARE